MLKTKSKSKKKIKRKNPSYKIQNFDVINLSELMKNYNKYIKEEIEMIIDHLGVSIYNNNADATLLKSSHFKEIIDDLPKNSWINIEN